MTLDLTKSSGQKILWDILTSPGVEAVHLGLPCGTSSRAREKPIPKEMRLARVPEFLDLLRITINDGLIALTACMPWPSRSSCGATAIDSDQHLGSSKQLVVGSFGETCKGTFSRSGNSPQLFTVCLFSCLLPWLYMEETYSLALNASSV